MKIEVVCFDMDGTLVRGTDSVEYLCGLNKKSQEHERIKRREADQAISWVKADYSKAALIGGLDTGSLEARLLQELSLIKNTEYVLQNLAKRHIKRVLVTSGPIQVAEIIGNAFGFDAYYGSQYHVKTSKFTGKIREHLDAFGKLDRLRSFCKRMNVDINHCVAVGDSESDIELFRSCGKSIALNYTDSLEGEASAYLTTDDLSDILRIIDSWLAE